MPAPSKAEKLEAALRAIFAAYVDESYDATKCTEDPCLFCTAMSEAQGLLLDIDDGLV